MIQKKKMIKMISPKRKKGEILNIDRNVTEKEPLPKKGQTVKRNKKADSDSDEDEYAFNKKLQDAKKDNPENRKTQALNIVEPEKSEDNSKKTKKIVRKKEKKR